MCIVSNIHYGLLMAVQRNEPFCTFEGDCISVLTILCSETQEIDRFLTERTSKKGPDCSQIYASLFKKQIKTVDTVSAYHFGLLHIKSINNDELIMLLLNIAWMRFMKYENDFCY